MYPYRMQQLIRERGKDEIVNVRHRASLYQTIARLERDGLIEVQGTARTENRPERTLYQLTDEGPRDHPRLAAKDACHGRRPSFPNFRPPSRSSTCWSRRRRGRSWRGGPTPWMPDWRRLAGVLDRARGLGAAPFPAGAGVPEDGDRGRAGLGARHRDTGRRPSPWSRAWIRSARIWRQNIHDDPELMPAARTSAEAKRRHPLLEKFKQHLEHCRTPEWREDGMTTLRRIAPALALLIIAPLIAEFLLGDFNIRQIGFIAVFIPDLWLPARCWYARSRGARAAAGRPCCCSRWPMR